MGPEEKKILCDPTNDIAMLYLSGPLIFGTAQSLTRQQTRLSDVQSLVVDFTDVPHLGVSASLVLETTIQEAVQRGCRVYLAGLEAQPRERFERLGIGDLVPASNWFSSRAEALKRAVAEGGGLRSGGEAEVPQPGG